MEEVDPLHLTPGESYYLDKPESKVFTNSRGLSSRGKGEFVKYEEGWTGAISAKFKNIESVNNKPFYFLPDSQYRPNESTFHVAPYKSMYNIYKIKGPHLQAREDKKVRVKAFEKMMNQEKLPMRPPTDKISLSSMFAETPEEKNQPREMNPPFIKGDQTFYGTDPDKSSLGTQLKPIYSEYLLDKKTAGRKRR